MARKAKRYSPPTNPQERIAEARAAIHRLEATLNTGANRFGEYGRNIRESIARWQETINREEANKKDA